MPTDMPDGWKQWCLYDVARYVNGRATKPAEVQRTGVPVIKIAELTGGISPSTDRVPSEAVQERHWVHPGDLLFAWSGSVGIYIYRGPPAALNQHIFRVVAREGIDQRYLRYLLEGQMPTFTGFVEDKKTTMGHVTVRDLQATSVAVPPIDEQRAIGHILGALDDKIELSGRMTETLGAIAQALFKSWFMDIDSARAIAEGWKFEEMETHVESCRGYSYDGTSIASGGVPFHNLNSIFEGGGYKFEGIKSLSDEFDDRRAVEPGDVIVANTEQGHDRLLLGCAALVPRRYGPRTPYSHHLYRIRVRAGSPLRPVFLLHLLNDPWMHDLISRYGNGTTVNMLPTDALRLPRIPIPPADLVTRFEALVLPSHHRIEAAAAECESLVALRNGLLPKLTSGELRVKNAARFIGRGV